VSNVTKELCDFPLAYLITFTTYGTRLPGEERGWVSRRQNRYGTPDLTSQPRLRLKMEDLLKGPPYGLGVSQRPLVLAAIKEACIHRGWQLEAVHVRPQHVHSVVGARAQPEFVLNTFKSYSSRKLNRACLDPLRRKRWTRHGSTKYLWTPGSVESAIKYVIEEQGEPLCIYNRAAKAEPRA
jgi:REP element-mobilizing transposase RayT